MRKNRGNADREESKRPPRRVDSQVIRRFERDVILSHLSSGNEDVLLGWSRWYRVDQMRRRVRPRRPRGSQRRPSGPDLASHRGEARPAECTEKLRQCDQREIQARPLQSLPEDRETHQHYDP